MKEQEKLRPDCHLRPDFFELHCPSTSDGMINPQYNDRSDNCDDHAIDVKACYWRCTKGGKQKTTHKGADYTQYNVKNYTLAAAGIELAGNETGDKTQNKPRDDGHRLVSFAGRC